MTPPPNLRKADIRACMTCALRNKHWENICSRFDGAVQGDDVCDEWRGA